MKRSRSNGQDNHARPDIKRPKSDQVLDRRPSNFTNNDHVHNQAAVQTINGPVYHGPVHATHVVVDRNARRPESKTVELLLDPEEKRRYLLQSLEFGQIDSRLDAVKIAHAETCQWLLDQEAYRDWLDDAQLGKHHGILWIKGKPATGKSTIVKFALTHSKRGVEDTKVISFFFSARGELLEKSAIGLFRSLLTQLLYLLPELQNVLDTCFVSANSVDPRDATSYHWNVEKLKQLFCTAIEQLRQQRVICFLDALDECDEDETRDIVRFFEKLCESAVSSDTSFRVCLSSRHYPHITVQNSVEFILEKQTGHHHDIALYLASELQIVDVGNMQAEQTRVDILERSSGIFLWVVLVVQILNKECDRGRVHALRQRLDEIPNDIEALFHDILTRDGQPGDELVLCLQWVLFAGRPLCLEELYHAVLAGLDVDSSNGSQSTHVSPETMAKFILHSSKGLVEETKSQPQKMQFIHESVRDFLRRGRGLQSDLFGCPQTFAARSHERLKQCCYMYHLNLDIYMEKCKRRWRSPVSSRSSSPEDSGESQKKTSSSVDQTMSYEPAANAFLSDYAIPALLYHSEKAHEQGICQRDFIKAFDLSKWLLWNKTISRSGRYRYSNSASLLYVLAVEDLPHLVALELETLSTIEIPGQKCGYPLYAAQRYDCKEVLKVFLSASPVSRPVDHLKLGVLSDKDVQKAVRSLQKRCNEVVDWFPPLLWATAYAEPEVAKCLLIGGRVDVNPNYLNKNGERSAFRAMPLHFAVERGHLQTLRLLLAYKNIDVNAMDGYGRTPLHLAALFGRAEAVQLLLEDTTLDVNKTDAWGQTPVHVAIESNHDEVVRLLSSRPEVDVRGLDACGRAPLSSAVEFGRAKMMEMLLARSDVDVNQPDGRGMTPLCVARLHDQMRIASVLQARGALSRQHIVVTMK